MHSSDRMPCGTVGFCGLCYSNAKGRSNHKGHFGYRKPRICKDVSMSSRLRRRSADDVNSSSGGGPVSSGRLFSSLPVLLEFLTLDRWEDGDPRTTGTILVFVEDGKWKACLNDRDGGLICFLSADDFEDLLRGLDQGLNADTLDWRVSKSSQGRGGRRK